MKPKQIHTSPWASAAKKTITGFAALFLCGYSIAAVPTTPNGISVEQNKFLHKGDSVYIDMEVRLDKVSVPSQASILFTPMLQADSKSLDLPAVQINGKKRQRAENRLFALHKSENEKKGLVISAADADKGVQTYTYNTVVLYEPWMENARFVLEGEQCECSGKPIPVSSEVLAERLTNFSDLCHFLPTFIVPATGPAKERSLTGKGYLNFPHDKFVLLPGFGDNATGLEQLVHSVEQVKEIPGARITGITITGYASPEGTYNKNLILSGNRAQALARYLKEKYGFSDQVFTLNGKGEDWQRLDTLVAHSNSKKKNDILSIIRQTGIFDGREKMLMDFSGGVPYRELERDIFPELRRCDYEIAYLLPPFSPSEGREVMKTNPSSLSLNEFYLLAENCPTGRAEYSEVYEVAARIYPQNDTVNINAAACALNRKDTVSAEQYLSRVTVQDAAYWNNMGILAGLKNEITKAMDYFTKAWKAGNNEAPANLKEMGTH